LQQALSNRSQFELSPVVDGSYPSEMRPVVAALNDLLVRLRDDVEAQRRFASNAAHQLRTPIAGIKTYLALLNRVQSKSDEKKVLIELGQGMDKLDRLVSSLLVLSRVEQTSCNMVTRIPLDLNDVARDVSRIFEAQAVEKDIELAFAPSPEAAMILGDPIVLQELVSNLVENAVQYTPVGGRVKIGVSNNGTIDLAIEDTGPGIPAAERERVFERFYRVLGTGVEGNGLGLAIVKEVAQMHEAVVRLDSGADNRGTKVTVEFKRAC
jgi:two-component system sensor histidine kinase TctE